MAKARGWTGGVVYFEAITAFAAMLRALVCHQSSRDHPTSDALMASGFSAEEVVSMSREALHAPASEIMLQSLHLRRLLSDALSNTCSATLGVQEVAAMRRGSKAGEPLADLAFGTLMRRILQRVRDRSDDQGLVARLPVCGATPFAPADDVLPEMEAVHGFSCVDDVSAYTWGPDTQTVITNVKAIVGDLPRGIFAACVAAKLCCWKSECLVALRGKGDTHCRV